MATASLMLSTQKGHALRLANRVEHEPVAFEVEEREAGRVELHGELGTEGIAVEGHGSHQVGHGECALMQPRQT